MSFLAEVTTGLEVWRRNVSKLLPSMFTGEYILLCGGLAIATTMEVDKKATIDLSAALPTRTTATKTLAMTTTLREGSATASQRSILLYPVRRGNATTSRTRGTRGNATTRGDGAMRGGGAGRLEVAV